MRSFPRPMPPTGAAHTSPSLLTISLRRLLIILHHSFIFAPLCALSCLYLLSWRASAFLGHWPQPWIDDPNFIARGDVLMDMFYVGVEPFLRWSMIGVVTVPLLMILLRRQYTRRWIIIALVFFSLTWLTLFADLGGRIAWFMD